MILLPLLKYLNEWSSKVLTPTGLKTGEGVARGFCTGLCRKAHSMYITRDMFKTSPILKTEIHFLCLVIFSPSHWHTSNANWCIILIIFQRSLHLCTMNDFKPLNLCLNLSKLTNRTFSISRNEHFPIHVNCTHWLFHHLSLPPWREE